VHAAAAAAGAEATSGPLEDSLPSFVAQTFQERYKVPTSYIPLCYVARDVPNGRCLLTQATLAFHVHIGCCPRWHGHTMFDGAPTIAW
jgi:hypothetical protein